MVTSSREKVETLKHGTHSSLSKLAYAHVQAPYAMSETQI